MSAATLLCLLLQSDRAHAISTPGPTPNPIPPPPDCSAYDPIGQPAITASGVASLVAGGTPGTMSQQSTVAIGTSATTGEPFVLGGGVRKFSAESEEEPGETNPVYQNGHWECCTDYRTHRECSTPPPPCDGTAIGSTYSDHNSNVSDDTKCWGYDCEGATYRTYKPHEDYMDTTWVCTADGWEQTACHYYSADRTCTTENKECKKKTPRDAGGYTVGLPKIIKTEESGNDCGAV